MNSRTTSLTLATGTGFPSTLGVRIERCTDSLVEGTLDAGVNHSTASGTRVHGGVLMAFADTLGSVGSMSQLSPGSWTTTVDSSTHFVHAAGPGILRGVAQSVHRGRTTHVWHTQIFDSQERLIAIVTQTQLILTRETGTGHRASVAEEVAAAAVDQNLQTSSYQTPVQTRPAADIETVPAQRLRQIFNAASEVFGRKGYAGTAVRDIAEAAGMPIATMYQYVSGKEDILRLVFETYMSEIAAALSSAANTQKTPRERLRDTVEANLRLYDSYRHQIRLMYQETRSFGEENRLRVLGLTRRTNRVWEDIIRDGVAAGDFACCNPSITANLIPMLCATWVLRHWSMEGNSLDDLTASILELLDRGIESSNRVRNS